MFRLRNIFFVLRTLNLRHCLLKVLPVGTTTYFFLEINLKIRKGSGSVVECFTPDRGVAGSSLTGVAALCP